MLTRFTYHIIYYTLQCVVLEKTEYVQFTYSSYWESAW